MLTGSLIGKESILFTFMFLHLQQHIQTHEDDDNQKYR